MGAADIDADWFVVEVGTEGVPDVAVAGQLVPRPAPHARVRRFDAHLGRWFDARGDELAAGDLFLLDGLLHRLGADGAAVVRGRAEEAVLADAEITWHLDRPRRDPQAADWVWVLGTHGEAGHQRLARVRPSAHFVFQGRVFERYPEARAVPDGIVLRETTEVLARVTDTFVRVAPRVVQLTLHAPGPGAESRIETLVGTEEHPFWVPALEAWVQMAELEAGMVLRGVGVGDGDAGRVIEQVEIGTEPARVFNLEVEGPVTYFVRGQGGHAGGSLVHNCTGGSCFVAGTRVVDAAATSVIEAVPTGDRVIAAAVDATAADGEPWVEVAEAPTAKGGATICDRVTGWAKRWAVPAMLLAACGQEAPVLPAADEAVQVYDVRTGDWFDARGSELEVGDTWLDDGQLRRWTEAGVEDRREATADDLAAADATWAYGQAEAEPRVPDADAWVLVLGDADEAGHWPLGDLDPAAVEAAGSRLAFQGRVFETADADGDGLLELRPTGDVLGRVVNTFVRIAPEVIDAEIAYADGARDTLTGTPNHPFWVPAVQDFVALGSLEVGTALHVQGGGEALLVSKIWRQGDVEVFDVEVEGLHNFYVRGQGSDAAGVLVHNSTAGNKVLGKFDVAPGVDAIGSEVVTKSPRKPNRLRPDTEAAGPHSTFKTDSSGKVTNHIEWAPNSRNPSGFDEVKRVDVTGRSHVNPDGTQVPTPHTSVKGTKGVRPATPARYRVSSFDGEPNGKRSDGVVAAAKVV